MIKIQENNGALEAILDTYVREGKQRYTANLFSYDDCAVKYSTRFLVFIQITYILRLATNCG